MTSLDRALSWFLEPASTARDAAHASPPVAEAEPGRGLGPALADPLASAGPRPAAPPQIGSAVVLGRPGHAEPVAAAVALALSQGARSRAATVAVIAAAKPVPASSDAGPRMDAADPGFLAADSCSSRVAEDSARDDPQSPASGGTRAARRLVARLRAHGLPASPRGRLAWVPVPAEHRQAAARRAVLVGAPAVVAVTAPRAPDIEELLAEQELLVLVMTDPGGPLARVAALAPGGVPVAVTRPLTRGPARSLAVAGVCAPRSVRGVLARASIPGAPPRAPA